MLWPVPTQTIYSFKKDDKGWGVWALQQALTSLGRTPGVDGWFGDKTHTAVSNYQSANGLYVDGVAGPKTQASILTNITKKVATEHLPDGLVQGITQAESGRLIFAVNSSVPGGVDLGYTQRRVYEPYEDQAFIDALDSLKQVKRLVDELSSKFSLFMTRDYVEDRNDTVEYAWRLAALNHNWPYGADRLSKGYTLSNTAATWVPAGTKFPTGEPVNTFAEWAKFYAMGSKTHNWAGLVTQQAFGVPNSG